MLRTSLASGWLLALVALSAASCAGSSAPAAPSSPLVIVSDFSNAPFSSWFEDDPEPVGFEPDLVRAVADELKRPVEWRKIPFDQLLDTASEDETVVVVATMGITPERKRTVRFSRPYFHTEIVCVVRDEPNAPRNHEDLAWRRVGASRGTTSERAVRLFLPAAVPVLDRAEGVTLDRMLTDRQIDAACMDGPDAARLTEDTSRGITRLDEPLAEEHYAMAMAQHNAALAARIDQALERLESSGLLAGLGKRYGIDG